MKSEQTANGWNIVILAKVEKDLLENETKNNFNQKHVIEFNGTNVSAENFTKEEKNKNAKEIVSLINGLDIRDSIVYKSEFKEDGKRNIHYIRHFICVDVKNYLKKLSELSKSLERIAVERQFFYFNQDTLKFNKMLLDLDTFYKKRFSINFSWMVKS